jgi:phosphomannomutase
VNVTPESDLGRIFKAYDVRGVVPDDLDEDVARRIGAAFADWSGAPRIAIGRDCRTSSESLAHALADGATSRGVDVVDLGLTGRPGPHAHREPQSAAVERHQVLP